MCYVPEYETVEDTRLKLQDRRSYVSRAVQKIGIIFYLTHTHTHKCNFTYFLFLSTFPPFPSALFALLFGFELIILKYVHPSTEEIFPALFFFQVLKANMDYLLRLFSVSLHKAREKEQKEDIQEEPTSSNTTTTSDNINLTHGRTPGSGDTGESSNISPYLGFPLLPLPPKEHHNYGPKNQHGVIPAEDKMGTLHNPFVDRVEQQEGNSRRSETLSSRVTEHKEAARQAAAVRFLPRTTHLENRKRKTEEAAEHGITISGQNEPLIGPKLPEPSKLDMEDKSLNTTVSMIRNTMKQVHVIIFLLEIKQCFHCDPNCFLHCSEISLIFFLRWHQVQRSNQWRRRSNHAVGFDQAV